MKPQSPLGKDFPSFGVNQQKASAMENIRGFVYILVAALLWGCIGPVAKVAFAQGLGPLEVAFWRAMIGWAFFFCHSLVLKKVGIRAGDIHVVLIFALLCVTAFYGSYQLAVALGGAARASVLLYTAPAWVAVMAAFFLHEKVGPKALAGIMACMTGVGFISLSGTGIAGHEFSWAGIIFGLLAGFTYALYYIFGKMLFTRYHPATIFSWILILGAAGLSPFIEFSTPTNVSWLALLFLGFLSTYCAYFFYARGLVRLKASRAAVIATMEPVAAAFLAYFFWQENLGPWGYFGACLIIAGVIIQAAGKRTDQAD